jgi:hypothetical protein
MATSSAAPPLLPLLRACEFAGVNNALFCACSWDGHCADTRRAFAPRIPIAHIQQTRMSPSSASSLFPLCAPALPLSRLPHDDKEKAELGSGFSSGPAPGRRGRRKKAERRGRKGRRRERGRASGTPRG